MAVIDQDFTIQFWNSTLESWTSTPRERWLGKPLDDVHPAWGHPALRNQMLGLFEGGDPVVFSPLSHPNLLPTPKDDPRRFHVKAARLPQDHGWWVVLSVEDVTTFCRTIDEHKSQGDQLQRRMKEVHHRVKNNLNILSGLVSLQRSRAQGSVVSTLDDLQSRIAALSEIHDLLYLPEGPSVGPVADYLASLATLLDRNLSVSSSHQLILDLVPDLVLPGEKTAVLGMVLAELMTNALKYGLRGDPGQTITVSLKAELGDCLFEVSHSGDHLPPDFDPQTSSGLGMVLLSAYADQLGTSLGWSRGATTRFWLRFAR
jgi:two-component sensor histidine kinase